MKFLETARRLKTALDSKNMKPQELADLSGVSKSSISQYVNGSHKPSNMSAGKMAEILGVDPLWLMGFNCPKTLNANSQFGTHFEMSNVEQDLLTHYRAADSGTQRAVRKLLDVEDKEEESAASGL